MENLNYHHLYYFWNVCRLGGFTKAAAALKLSQSSVSEQVSLLEARLGQKLLERTTRRVQVTEAGAAALRFADTIFGAGQELLDFMSLRPSTRQQRLRFGALAGLSRNLQGRFLAPLLDRDDVQFSVTVGESRRLLKLLREHSLDLVLSTYPAGESETGELYAHPLTSSPLCLVMRPKKGLSRKNYLEMLSSERVYLPSLALESRADFDHFAHSKGLTLKVGGEVDDVALLRVLALTGKGIVLIPKMGVANDLTNRNLVLVHEFKNFTQHFYAITRQKRFPNPLIAELVRAFR